jgi:hypothetical protein
MLLAEFALQKSLHLEDFLLSVVLLGVLFWVAYAMPLGSLGMPCSGVSVTDWIHVAPPIRPP